MTASAWTYTLIPAAAALAGAAVAMRLKPSPTTVSAIQHFAAGVIFAAAAGEILPDVMHRNSPLATITGGAVGVLAMVLIKHLGADARGAFGLMVMVGIDLLIDGLVLGLGFAAGDTAGVLLTVALTLEVLFLGLTVANKLKATSNLKSLGLVAGLVLLLPAGALLAVPAQAFPALVMAGLMSFGLIALLYLVTEELLVEAHETPDRPWITALFFAGFLMLLTLEELMAAPIAR
jgi:ZIP family zinc transporter